MFPDPATGNTLLVVRPRRGGDVPGEVLGEEWGGIIVCDGWASYKAYRIQGRRAHIIREMRHASEKCKCVRCGRAPAAPRGICRRMRHCIGAHVRRTARQEAPQAAQADLCNGLQPQGLLCSRQVHGNARQGAAQPARVRQGSLHTAHKQCGRARLAGDGSAQEDTRRHQVGGHHGADGQPVLVCLDVEEPRNRLPPGDRKVRLGGADQVNTSKSITLYPGMEEQSGSSRVGATVSAADAAARFTGMAGGSVGAVGGG